MPQPPEIARALAQAQAQQQAQKQLNDVLEATIRQPHTIERVQSSLVALQPEGDNLVLLVASLDGRRRDIVMSEQAVAGIAKQYAERQAAKIEAPELA